MVCRAALFDRLALTTHQVPFWFGFVECKRLTRLGVQGDWFQTLVNLVVEIARELTCFVYFPKVFFCMLGDWGNSFHACCSVYEPWCFLLCCKIWFFSRFAQCHLWFLGLLKGLWGNICFNSSLLLKKIQVKQQLLSRICWIVPSSCWPKSVLFPALFAAFGHHWFPLGHFQRWSQLFPLRKASETGTLSIFTCED